MAIEPLSLARFESFKSEYMLQWLFFLGYRGGFSVFLEFYRVLTTLLWYSFSQNLIASTWAFSSFYSVFLGLQGTSNFSLLPLRAHAVTVAQELVFSFFFIASFFWFDQAESPQLTFYLQDPLRLVILAIWFSLRFQLFCCLPLLSFFPNSWNLLLLG